VVVVPSFGQADELVEKVAERASWTLIRTVQRVAEIQAASADQVAEQRVWTLTRGVRAAVDEQSVALGSLWGISRIVAGEHPELWGGAIDACVVDANTGPRLLGVLRGTAGKGTEDVISLTAEATESVRLRQIERSTDG